MGFNYTKLINFYWCLLVCLLMSISSFGQTRVFANGTISQSNTDNSANAIDSDLSTKAEIRAKDGLGNYSGNLELEFPSLLPAETTVYVKIDAENPILAPLLAGGLGNFLGAIAVSKQEFTVQVKNVNTVVLQANSNDDGDFGTSRMRLVMDEAGDYFIVITPDQAFNRIRLINRIDQGLSSIGTKRLGVYGAFYNSSEIIGDCGSPSFTSYDGSPSGLLGVGGAGINDPEDAIDGDENTFSELNLGSIGIGSSMEQILYFEELSHSNEVFNLNLKLNSDLLALGVLDHIEISGYNGASLVASENLTDLLNLDLLGLFQNNENAEVPFAPGTPIDRIVIRFSSFISLALPSQKLEIYEINKVPGPPTFDASSQDVDICKGESASLIAIADPNDLDLRWYDSAVDGTLLGTVASGTPFVTSAILTDTTFYVAAAENGCPEESERTQVEVTLTPSPEASDITVTGNESTICSTDTVILIPGSTLTGDFSWYLDANKTNQITDGMVDTGITYNIDTNDELTITGLSGLNSPYTYYVSVTDSSTDCENMAGELKSVVVTIQDNILAPTITLDPNITTDDIVNSDEALGVINITGVVSGDAQVNDVVTLIINNVTYQGNVAANFSFSIPVNGSDLIADTDLTIDASVETTNGICTNTGTDTESYTVDTTDPTPPTVDTLLTNDTTPTITGTADSADLLTVTLNGITYTEGDGNLTDNGDDTWSLTVPAGNELAEGTYDVAATTTDLAGNSADDSTTDELTIDLTDPTLPTVVPLLTNNTTPTITGTADSADLLTVTLDGITYTEGDGNLTDNGDDTWTLTVPPGNELTEGTYDVSVTVTDLAGNSADDSTTDELTIDLTDPTVPTVDPLLTNDSTPTITGKADSADLLTVTLNGITYSEGDGNLTDNGDDTWSLTVPAGNELVEGTYDVSVTVTDLAGNSADDSTTDELTIDLTDPTVPTVDTLLTNDTTPTITGTADSADLLTVTLDGTTYTEGDGNLTDNGDDTWSLTVPAGNELVEGTYDVSVTVTDLAGNSADDSTTDELTIDLTDPTVPTVDPLLTNDTTPTITGTADSADFLTVTLDGITYTEGDGNLTDNGDDTWSLTVPAGNELVEGTYDLSATTTDLAGNISNDSTTDELTIDLTDPTVPTVDPLLTNDTTPTITGTADSADLLTVTLNGITYTEGDGNLTDNGDDTWSLTVPAGNELAEGTYDLAATTTDLAGNTANDTSTDELTIDLTDPTVPTVDPLLTNDTTPTITGTADSADLLTVTLNGITYSEGDGNLTDNGDDTWSLTVPAGNELTEGTYDVSVTVTDLAGNSADDSTTDELTIDLTDPTAPTVDLLLTNDTTPTITGTADSADFLTVTLDGITYTEGDGNLTDNGDDTWSLTVPAGNELVEGTYDLSATTTDLAGSTADDTTTDELTIDLTDPTVPTVDSLLTNDTTPTITGTADSADLLTVTLNGITYTEGDGNLTDNGDDTWSLTVPAGNELAEGTYDLAATTTDLAGNTANDTSTDELTIDLTDPTVPTVDPLLTNDTTPTITGTADSADLLTVTLNGITYTEGDGNLTDNGDDTWSLTVPTGNELAEGTYDVAATTTDLAGNTAVDNTTDELIIDLTNPTVPTVDPLLTNDTTPTITGTADSADLLTVTLDGTTYTEGDGNLTDNGDDTWSLTVPPGNELTEGTYDVSATTTDLAGNSADDSTTDELTIDLTDPTVPTVDSLLTNDTTPTITGTADSADLLTVTLDGTTYTEGDGNLTDNGDDTWSLTMPAGNELVEGTYDVSVTVTDLAGNSADDSTTDELTIDLTDPTAPTVDPLLTNDTTPTITGTADSADLLTVTLNGITYTEGDGNLTDNGDDTWSLTVPTGNELAEGTYDVSVTVTDLAGNTANDSTTDELTIDLTDPTVPTVDPLLTNDTTPTITGTADSADFLTVTLDGITYTEGDGNLTDNGDDTWSLTVPAGNELVEGTYDLSATTTDLAGNSADDSTTDELTIDLTDPTVPTVDPLLTNDTTPTITGTADSADFLTVTLDGTTYTEGDGNLTDNGDDTWTLTVPPGNELTEGIYDVSVTVTDLAGNSADDSTTEEVTIASIQPPTTNSTIQEFCAIDLPSLHDIQINESDVLWYDHETGENLLDASTLLEHQKTYYASQFSSDLKTSTRLAISINLIEPPSPTSESLTQVFSAAGNPTLGDIHVNESNIIWYDAPVLGNILDFDAPLIDGKVYYAAVVDSNCESRNRLAIRVQVDGISDLTISKVASTYDPMVGENINFTITVTNDGDTNFTDIIINEIIESGFTYFQYTASKGTYNASNGEWNIDTIGPSEKVELNIGATVKTTGSYRNIASISKSIPLDHNLENNRIEITLEPTCLVIYNEFTPNDDGDNDYFRIDCIESFPGSDFQVFNRYGALVYQKESYQNDWRGLANVNSVVRKGEPLPTGTYFYILKTDALSEGKTGWLFLRKD